jgi:uncharacterized membrane protein
MIGPRRREATRLEAFSDAMIAFAAALVVLSLDVPKGYSDLIENLQGFIPFALTFAALLLVWVAHKNLFRRYPLDDTFTIVTNSVFLFTILFYAYPLKFIVGSVVEIFVHGNDAVLASPGELRNLFVLYGLGWMIVFFCIALLYWHAARSAAELGLSEIEEYDAVSDSRYYLGFVLAGVVSVALAIANVGVSFGVPGIAYCLVGVFAAANAYARRLNRPDSVSAALGPAPVHVFIPEAPHD